MRARDAGGDWYEIDVPPQIATALATGDQFGLMLTDEKGQTRTRHAISSRESADPPLLIVEGTRSGMTPGRVRALTPLIYSHVNPYGLFRLDMEERLPLAEVGA